MRFYCFWLFALSCGVASSQSHDSLMHFLMQARKTNNTQKQSYYLNALAFDRYEKGQYDSSKYYYQQALLLNSKLKIDTLIAQNLNDIGMVSYQMGLLDTCLFYYKEALAIYKRQANPAKEAVIQLNLSMIYKDKGAYENALELALESSVKLEKVNSLQALGSCYNNIALIYAKLREFDRALEFHRKALNIRRKIGNRKGEAQSYNNIANIYKDSNALDSALYYYEKSLDLKTAVNDVPGSASTLNNMGEVMMSLNRLPEAQAFLHKSLRIKEQSGNKAGEVYSQNNLAKVALIQKQYGQAQKYLDLAEKNALTLGLLEQLRFNYEIRIQLLKETNNTRQAFLYAEKLMTIKDSLLTKERAETLAQIQTSYEIKQKEQQISLLEKEKELQQSAIEINNAWIKGLILTTVLALIIVILLYNQFQQEQRNKRKVETLLQELHHRVKNNLQILSSVLSLQSQQLTDENALQAVRSSESRVNAMALIHRKLYTQDKNRTVNIKEYITELITYLVHTYGFYRKDLKLNLTLQEIQLDVDKAIPLGLIINELISNAFKHAYIDHPAPELSVTLAQSNYAELCIDIQDNGNGARSGNETNSVSFGLKLVNMLMSELKGKYEMNTQEGTRYQLIIPVK